MPFGTLLLDNPFMSVNPADTNVFLPAGGVSQARTLITCTNILAVEAFDQNTGSFSTTQNVRFGIDINMDIGRGLDLSPWGYS